MVTNLTTLTGRGLRHISIGAKDSLADYGVLITKDTQTDNFSAKSLTDDLPQKNGIIDYSDIGGKLFYEPRELIYKFKLVGRTEQELEERRAALYSWLDGSKKCTISDSKYAITENNVTTQWSFTNCVLKTFEYESGEKSIEICYGYVSATLLCDPYMAKSGEVNKRALKFANVLGSSDTATIAVTTNAYTVTKHDGTTATGSLPTGARKYRLVAYCENDPTITLGQTTITPETVFDLPDSATITITGGGYGYYEMWRDTRTGVRL